MPTRSRRSAYGATNTAEHKALRKALIARLRDGDPCPRCGRPMYRAQARWLDLGHVIDRARGGTLADGARLEHRACNRRAGQRLGARMRARRATLWPSSRRW
jgi:hypothetical protein